MGMKKKILLVGTGMGLTGTTLDTSLIKPPSEEELRNMISEKMSKIDEMLEEDKPHFLAIGVDMGEETRRMAGIILAESLAKHMPILICSHEKAEELNRLDNIEDITASLVLPAPPPIFEITNYKFDEMPVLKGDYFEANKKSFGGHKKGKNRKLRRR